MSALQAWLAERPSADGPLFLNAQGRRLTRSGLAYILRKFALRAGLTPRHCSHISPHVIRHTTAMHLLEAGVDITTIAAWLGHSQLDTTHGYIEINLRMKQKALQRQHSHNSPSARSPMAIYSIGSTNSVAARVMCSTTSYHPPPRAIHHAHST